jgi:lysyl-tRNA synthetase, class II
MYFEYRAKKINELRVSKDPDPYPHKFQVSMAIPEFIEKYSHLQRGEQLKDIQVSMAGRVMVIRDNNKLKFYDLHGEV